MNEWLAYIESIHSADIEFGLERVSDVFTKLFPNGLKSRVITVGGTNGKGSTCAYIESILLSAGYRCGKNTSPHIHLFNERVFVNGEMVDDETLIGAFEQVELARKEEKLTYFEFTFLVALHVFEVQKVQFAICEVGMGGRLDAVNILSPEVSVITNIGLDHTQWLGDTREAVAMEKVAISRTGKACIIGDVDFPPNAFKYLQDHKVKACLNDKNFEVNNAKDGEWSIRLKKDHGTLFHEINEDFLCGLPPLGGEHQYQNASCAILALLSLDAIQINLEQIQAGLSSVSVPGRCQVLSEYPLVVVDVAHNEDSIKALAEFIADQKNISGKKIAVCSMLKDKDISNSLANISNNIDCWYIAPLAVPRAASVQHIQEAIREKQENAHIVQFDSIFSAYLSAKQKLKEDDCLLVFGSFFVVGDILRHHNIIH